MGNTFFVAALVGFVLILSHTANRTAVSAHHLWSEFMQLSGYRIGERDPRLVALKQYFVHFGYLESGGNKTEPSHEFDADLEAAVKKYQQFFGLNVTGVLDGATVDQLSRPRCGVPDFPGVAPSVKPGHLDDLAKVHYVIGGNPWPSTPRNLTYFISADHQPFAASDLSRVIGAAFATWATFAPFKFHEVTDPGMADLHIGFYSGDHGDPFPFDGPLGVLGHSFYPEDGRCHFDATENWVIDPAKLTAGPSAVDLQSVAVHEIGHLLGLAHSTDQRAIMYPYVYPQTQKLLLTSDDIDGIKQMYLPNCC